MAFTRTLHLALTVLLIFLGSTPPLRSEPTSGTSTTSLSSSDRPGGQRAKGIDDCAALDSKPDALEGQALGEKEGEIVGRPVVGSNGQIYAHLLGRGVAEIKPRSTPPSRFVSFPKLWDLAGVFNRTSVLGGCFSLSGERQLACYIRAIDHASGRQRWCLKVVAPHGLVAAVAQGSSIVVAELRGIVASLDVVEGRDVRDGRLRWRHEGGFRAARFPAAFDEVEGRILLIQGSIVHVQELASGRIVRSIATDNGERSERLLEAAFLGPDFVLIYEKRRDKRMVTIFRTATGREIWRKRLPSHIRHVYPIGNAALLLAGQSSLSKVRASDGEVLWEVSDELGGFDWSINSERAGAVPVLLGVGGLVDDHHAGCDFLEARSSKTGELLWKAAGSVTEGGAYPAGRLGRNDPNLVLWSSPSSIWLLDTKTNVAESLYGRGGWPYMVDNPACPITRRPEAERIIEIINPSIPHPRE